MSPSRSPLERDQVWVIREGFLGEISLMKFKQVLQYQNHPLPKFSADFHVLKCPECHENMGSGEGICFTYLSKKVLNKIGQVRIRCCDKQEVEKHSGQGQQHGQRSRGKKNLAHPRNRKASMTGTSCEGEDREE